MRVRGIRGAITVEENLAKSIVAATKELLLEVISANEVDLEEIASIFFTLTDDLDAQFPAVAAREIGMRDVPLLCSREVPIQPSLKSCIRILMHINTDKKQTEIRHIYLRKAKALRPDLEKTD
ncbi:MAG: chorismate mutase [Candidatus Margulisiibacteriota bacterium]|nr:MAG: chorismate mutase [Candidatus Margulisbacteria bacterium GWD2_39_127]OGI03723.1 MAG: chorismate mutase [Candidatus Margulisbacteria bacterium GWF2_38_17]OGI06843.1 MAG: chorismate mutase [Candidatus Margulisbacteria bacterium GWE2_39_32]PZM77062.1 MAG: chorismate mutase [Candidatus Margulisiibacteriota bacterium]HAR64438.1 chorismate mutase [Candidatus Margulisiibacteriota bacterium]